MNGRSSKRKGGYSPKDKGNKFEREIVNAARALGLDAERAYGSNGRALGEVEGVDLTLGTLRVQAKRRARIASWLLPPDGCDAVAVRQDRGDTLVVLRFEVLCELLRRVR